LRYHAGRLNQFLLKYNSDILFLQETKTTTENTAHLTLQLEKGYLVVTNCMSEDKDISVKFQIATAALNSNEKQIDTTAKGGIVTAIKQSFIAQNPGLSFKPEGIVKHPSKRALLITLSNDIALVNVYGQSSNHNLFLKGFPDINNSYACMSKKNIHQYNPETSVQKQKSHLGWRSQSEHDRQIDSGEKKNNRRKNS
jgi:exonuclease III